jgi:hypothetical protein
MSSDTTAPDWYINHFRGFGYTTEGLNDTWARLTDEARASYRRVLNPTPTIVED